MDKHRIIIMVKGGLVQDVQKPLPLRNVIVEIHDYDTDNTEYGDILDTDTAGDQFRLEIW